MRRTLTLLTTLCVLLLVVWYSYWLGWGGTGREHWERYQKGDLDSFRRHDTNIDYDEVLRANLKNNEIKKKEERIQHKMKYKLRGEVLEFTLDDVVSKTSCVSFVTTRKNSKLCVHDKLYDPFISSHIRDAGTWEPDLMSVMHSALYNTPDMHLLDIGCNIGAFTMYAASMGRRVVALDPFRSNLFMLHSSLTYAGLRDNVLLLLNAVSEYAQSMRVVMNEKNIGGSRVEPITDGVAKGDLIVDAITLDDLIGVVNFTKIFIKMDIEGHEAKVLRHASEFFKHYDVRYLLMEWTFHDGSSGSEIIDFLVERGFRPYADALHQVVLDIDDHSFWPDNVVWYRRYE